MFSAGGQFLRVKYLKIKLNLEKFEKVEKDFQLQIDMIVNRFKVVSTYRHIKSSFYRDYYDLRVGY